MLNNEFRLIGTIVSDFEKTGSESYPKYKLMLEVEKKTKGRTATYPLVVYEKNTSVDINVSLKGKRVIATGYVDMYKDFMSLVLQEFEIIGGGAEAVENTEKEIVVNQAAANAYVRDDYEEPAPANVDLPDDDLPF